jgi:hypothetical protein
MKPGFLFLLLSVAIFYPFSLQAKEVAGVNISETISLSDQSTKLILNGTGIRKKFIFDIYVGSLYLEKKVSSAKEIYTLHGEKRISMHFLYSEVSKEKLVNGWNDGFENNHTSEELGKLKERITQFNNLFVSVKKGDVINLDFIPTTGTSITIKGKSMGLIEGDDFFIAVLKIWLGEDPADDDLKEAMLGIIMTDNDD